MRRWLKVQGSSLKTLKQVRMYSIPISDPRVNELITWYLGTLQRAIDIIWENIEWRYRFPRIKRRKQVLIVPSKFKAPDYRRASLSRRSYVTSFY